MNNGLECYGGFIRVSMLDSLILGKIKKMWDTKDENYWCGF